MFLPHPRVNLSIVGSLRDREVAFSASDCQVSNFESCVWRTVSSHSTHHPQKVLLAQFSLYVHKGGLNTDSFHFISLGYERVYLPLGKVADTPVHIQGDDLFSVNMIHLCNFGFMLDQRRDAGPTLNQHGIDVCCPLSTLES